MDESNFLIRDWPLGNCFLGIQTFIIKTISYNLTIYDMLICIVYFFALFMHNQTNLKNDLPLHLTCGLPVYPGWHWHRCPPGVLVHNAFSPQVLATLHSSISIQPAFKFLGSYVHPCSHTQYASLPSARQKACAEQVTPAQADDPPPHDRPGGAPRNGAKQEHVWLPGVFRHCAFGPQSPGRMLHSSMSSQTRPEKHQKFNHVVF